MPFVLKDLAYNMKSGLYEIEENGIIYAMQLEETRSLKEYFRSAQGVKFPFISEWYCRLDRVTKKAIKRSGDLPNAIPGEDGFYPDIDYDG